MVLLLVIIVSSCPVVVIIVKVPSSANSSNIDCGGVVVEVIVTIVEEESSPSTFFETFFFCFRVLGRGDTDGTLEDSVVLLGSAEAAASVGEVGLPLIGVSVWVLIINGGAVVGAAVVDRRIFLRCGPAVERMTSMCVTSSSRPEDDGDDDVAINGSSVDGE